MSPPPGEITLLLSDLQQGNTAAADKLMPLVYRHLRQMAAYYFQHERPGHTLQPTALVHEAYIRLMKPGQAHWKNRAHFYGVAARAMRQILVEHSRAHKAEKRGGGREKLELDEALVFSREKSPELLALDDALTRLKEFDPRQSRIVEMRFFGGMSLRETAEALGVGVTTVKWEWNLAKAWLRREIEAAQ